MVANVRAVSLVGSTSLLETIRIKIFWYCLGGSAYASKISSESAGCTEPNYCLNGINIVVP